MERIVKIFKVHFLIVLSQLSVQQTELMLALTCWYKHEPPGVSEISCFGELDACVCVYKNF